MKIGKETIHPLGPLIIIVLSGIFTFYVWWFGVAFFLLFFGLGSLSYYFQTKVFSANHLLYRPGFIKNNKTGKYIPIVQIGERERKPVKGLFDIEFDDPDSAIAEVCQTSKLLNNLK